MAAAIPPQVSDTVQGARDEVVSEVAGQFQMAARLGESGEYILHHILGRVHPAGEHHGDLQKVAMVLVVRSPQGVATAAP
jgi:hypothetical protein